MLDVRDDAYDLLAKRGYDPAFGARPLRRIITNLIEDPLSEGVLEAASAPAIRSSSIRPRWRAARPTCGYARARGRRRGRERGRGRVTRQPRQGAGSRSGCVAI